MFSWSNTEILDYIKSCVLKNGASSVFNFVRTIFQSAKSGMVSKEELQEAFSKLGIELIVRNMEKLIKLFGRNNEISARELVQTMVGEMDNSRTEVIQKAFAKIDSDNDGKISIEEIKSSFNANESLKVVEKKTETLAEFLDVIDIFFFTIVCLRIIHYRKEKQMKIR